MQIAFFEVKTLEKRKIIKALGSGNTLSFFKEPLTIKNVDKAKDADVVSIFIYSKITADVIKAIPNLKLITTRSTGFDHIDLATAKAKKIIVCNVPTYGDNTVAEHTFALILALSRNVHKSYVRTMRNDYSIEGLIGFDLKGKTIGVIGTGKIGMHVIKIARGFGMNVLAFDVRQDKFLSEVLDFTYVSLEHLLKNANIISLHAPYNEHTHHLINKDNTKLIKKGALLINTSRGGLVDTNALLDALDDGTLSGAGLDVLEGEQLIKEEKQLLHDPTKMNAMGEMLRDHLLLSHDNVVFTPHIAFYSQEALERILETTLDNMQNFFNNKTINQV